MRHTISVDLRLVQFVFFFGLASIAAGYVVNPTFAQPRHAAAGVRLDGTALPVMSAAGPTGEYKKAWEAMHGRSGRSEYKARWEALHGRSGVPQETGGGQDGSNGEKDEHVAPRSGIEMSAAKKQEEPPSTEAEENGGPSDEYKKTWEAMHGGGEHVRHGGVEMSAAKKQKKPPSAEENGGPSDEYKKRWEAIHGGGEQFRRSGVEMNAAKKQKKPASEEYIKQWEAMHGAKWRPK